MRLDLQTYPIHTPSHTLTELTEQAKASGTDLVAITEFTDNPKYPDRRFSRFYRDAQDSKKEIGRLVGPRTVTGFTIDKVTYLQAQCGWVTFGNYRFQLQRVGQSETPTPNDYFLRAVKQAREEGALLLLGRVEGLKEDDYPQFLDSVQHNVDGVMWDSQARFGRYRSANANLTNITNKPVIPVSNAHQAYLPFANITVLTRPDIGRSNISASTVTVDSYSTDDLLEKIRRAIKETRFQAELARSPILHTLAWQVTLVLRGKAGFSGKDYSWHDNLSPQ